MEGRASCAAMTVAIVVIGDFGVLVSLKEE
jgi:hypothetical protein